MKIRIAVSRIIVVALFCIVTISVAWTALTVLRIVRARSGGNAAPATESKIRTNEGISLPRFTGECRAAELADNLLALAYHEALEAGEDGARSLILLNASINFDAIDSTFFYRYVFVSECACPLAKKDRYGVNLKYVNPRTLEVFREERHANLSAEEVNRFDELLFLKGGD